MIRSLGSIVTPSTTRSVFASRIVAVNAQDDDQETFVPVCSTSTVMKSSLSATGAVPASRLTHHGASRSKQLQHRQGGHQLPFLFYQPQTQEAVPTFVVATTPTRTLTESVGMEAAVTLSGRVLPVVTESTTFLATTWPMSAPSAAILESRSHRLLHHTRNIRRSIVHVWTIPSVFVSRRVVAIRNGQTTDTVTKCTINTQGTGSDRFVGTVVANQRKSVPNYGGTANCAEPPRMTNF